MTKRDKLLAQVLRGTADHNIPFAELCLLMNQLGFDERIKGSHHIFTQTGLEEILNFQPRDDGKAKPYQVKQARQIILKYKLGRD
jgi:predicted RNA binding protein YcfA (HicA-like mRNA interferase family)